MTFPDALRPRWTVVCRICPACGASDIINATPTIRPDPSGDTAECSCCSYVGPMPQFDPERKGTA